MKLKAASTSLSCFPQLNIRVFVKCRHIDAVKNIKIVISSAPTTTSTKGHEVYCFTNKLKISMPLFQNKVGLGEISDYRPDFTVTGSLQ